MTDFFRLYVPTGLFANTHHDGKREHNHTSPDTQASRMASEDHMKVKLIALLLICSVTAVLAADPATAPLSKATTDKQNASATFVRKATQDGMFEVAAGKLALTKTSHADIKAFAQQMIQDHGNANDELKKVAGTRYEVPTQLDADHQAKLELLMSKSGGDFDHSYSTEMIRGHDIAIQLFTEAASDAAINSELQAFAHKILPTLHKHQTLATKLPGDRGK
jgi:putative membrane protein